MSGPPPTPLHLRLLKGNPGKRPIRPEVEPAQAPTCPDPPPFLRGYASDEYWPAKESPCENRERRGGRYDQLRRQFRHDAGRAVAHCRGHWRAAGRAEQVRRPVGLDRRLWAPMAARWPSLGGPPIWPYGF